MNFRRKGQIFALSTTFAWISIGCWYLSSHLLTLDLVEKNVGTVVVAVGWYILSMMAVCRLDSWRSQQRAAQPLESMTVRCAVCDGDEFLEGPSGGLCTNIKCVGCSAEYNFGPGTMERIYRK
jgi:hypothetical protein